MRKLCVLNLAGGMPANSKVFFIQFGIPREEESTADPNNTEFPCKIDTSASAFDPTLLIDQSNKFYESIRFIDTSNGVEGGITNLNVRKRMSTTVFVGVHDKCIPRDSSVSSN